MWNACNDGGTSKKTIYAELACIHALCDCCIVYLVFTLFFNFHLFVFLDGLSLLLFVCNSSYYLFTAKIVNQTANQ